MAIKKIVFQIKSLGAIGNSKIDDNPLYASAINVYEDTYQNDWTEGILIEHAEYIRDVLLGRRQRDDVKFPGIIWKPATAPVTGTDYVNVEPDTFIEEGENWTVAVLDKWAESQGLKHEYKRKNDPITGEPAAYNSHHIFL